MGGTFTLALIINTFNQPDYLDRVLRAVSGQSVLPDEVLLAAWCMACRKRAFSSA